MTIKIKHLIEELKKTEHGFKHIVKAGKDILSDKSLGHFVIAGKLLTHKAYQARMLSAYLLGELSPNDNGALQILTTKVTMDENWKVQEMLAKAVDSYCKATGYINALPSIKEWLEGGNQNLKRAVIEGLRAWTSRPYFKENPKAAITIISRHKSEDSEYVRKSAGNSLRDISKKYPQLVQQEIATWDLTNPKTFFTYKLVTKKKG